MRMMKKRKKNRCPKCEKKKELIECWDYGFQETFWYCKKCMKESGMEKYDEEKINKR